VSPQVGQRIVSTLSGRPSPSSTSDHTQSSHLALQRSCLLRTCLIREPSRDRPWASRFSVRGNRARDPKMIVRGLRRVRRRVGSGERLPAPVAENAFPAGIETRGEVEEVLRLIAGAILDLHGRPGYLGFLRMVVADSRQLPWIAEAFAAVMDPQTERLARYFGHLTALGILDCRKPGGGGPPVHRDDQRVLSMALDARPRTRAGSKAGRDRRGRPNVPAALPPAARGGDPDSCWRAAAAVAQISKP
jgi:hypothetical protein